jgi:hypothetical protein
MDELRVLVEKINFELRMFSEDAGANIVRSNRAAGARARKRSLNLGKMFKEYRKLSVQ